MSENDEPKWWIIVFIEDGKMSVKFADIKYEESDLMMECSAERITILHHIPLTLGIGAEHTRLDEMMKTLGTFLASVGRGQFEINLDEIIERVALTAFMAGTQHGEVIIPPDPDDEA